jgi:hypothetical protein
MRAAQHQLVADAVLIQAAAAVRQQCALDSAIRCVSVHVEFMLQALTRNYYIVHSHYCIVNRAFKWSAVVRKYRVLLMQLLQFQQCQLVSLNMTWQLQPLNNC